MKNKLFIICCLLLAVLTLFSSCGTQTSPAGTTLPPADTTKPDSQTPTSVTPTQTPTPTPTLTPTPAITPTPTPKPTTTSQPTETTENEHVVVYKVDSSVLTAAGERSVYYLKTPTIFLPHFPQIHSVSDFSVSAAIILVSYLRERSIRVSPQFGQKVD